MQVLVTGGGGFLGLAIVRQLLTAGHTVRTLSRGEHLHLASLGVQHFQADLTDVAWLMTAAKGCDVVFHVAAKAGIWGDWKDYWDANVQGTRTVLQVCQKLDIPKLVYTSSPSVTFHGIDQNGISETEASYPSKFLAYYPHTKAIAEREVLAANRSSFSTVALRPHLIWGPGDQHLIPRLIHKAKQGKLRRVGNVSNQVDAVFVENAAAAHLLAAERLGPQAMCAGKAYFITNNEPVILWDFMNRILSLAGIPPVTKKISPSMAYAIGGALEFTYGICGIRREPPMTRFVAKQLATNHWFDPRAAQEDLGYFPRISMAEGLVRVKEWLQSDSGKLA